MYRTQIPAVDKGLAGDLLNTLLKYDCSEALGFPQAESHIPYFHAVNLSRNDQILYLIGIGGVFETSNSTCSVSIFRYSKQIFRTEPKIDGAIACRGSC